jgi:hypothetical protein
MNSPYCNNDPATTVACHLNYHWAGKGGAQKADDCAVFFGCSGCHTAYDQKKLGENEHFYVLKALTKTTRRLRDLGI